MKRITSIYRLSKLLWVIALVRTVVWIAVPLIRAILDSQITLENFLIISLQTAAQDNLGIVILNCIFGAAVGVFFFWTIEALSKSFMRNRKSTWLYFALYLYLLQAVSASIYLQPLPLEAMTLPAQEFALIIFPRLIGTLLALIVGYRFFVSRIKAEVELAYGKEGHDK